MVIYNNNYNKSNFFNLYLSISYYVYILLKNILFTFVLLLSLILLVYSKNNKNIENYTKNRILTITYPYAEIINIFDNISSGLTNSFNNFKNIKQINKDLIKQNFELQTKNFKLKILEDENKELKKLLNVLSTKNEIDYSLEKINIINQTSFSNRIEIKSNNKMKNNDLVIDEFGNLVGKVINVNAKSATILLLTDKDFKIPAILEKSMTKVIIGGNLSNMLDINYFLGEKFNILEGENAYTSDDGNISQSGILIGKVSKDKNNIIKVDIGTKLDRINYVIILHNNTYIDENLINNDIENKKILNDTKQEESIIKDYNTVIDENLKKKLNDI